MKKDLILHAFILILMTACSSTPELSLEDHDKGTYLFHRKLKDEYTKFFARTIFKDNLYVQAGPALVNYNNLQLMRLKSLTPTQSMEKHYFAKDGTQHAYLYHVLNSSFDQEQDSKTYFFSFNMVLNSFGQFESLNYGLKLTIRCKDKIPCHLSPAADMLKHLDPYEFHFTPLEEDSLITSNVDLSKFSDTEATAISTRTIYRGMGQKAAEAAIGKKSHHIHGFHNVVFTDGFVSDFEFRPRHDLSLFNR